MTCCRDRIYEDLMSVKSRERNNCCEVAFRGKERELALMEQLNRERICCCQKVAQAEARCCCGVHSW